MALPKLIHALQNPALYPHPVSAFKVIETHISWIILTGTYAYKIKKPVDFAVLNFSTLTQRQHFCAEELRLNKLVAPEFYDSVLAITGTDSTPEFNGAGAVIEYAVKMREFAQANILTQLVAHPGLTDTAVQQLAHVLANFHLTAAPAPHAATYGTPASVQFPVAQNFTQILAWLRTADEVAVITQLESWAAAQYQQLLPLLIARRRDGFIRDCHGDLHLGNIIWQDNKITLFDRLEFNPDLRWIDVLADFAFLWMDLLDKQQFALANQLRNLYLMQTGDYTGLTLLHYYTAYRAMVRAKIALFQTTQFEQTSAQSAALRATYANYINLAQACQIHPAPVLIIMQGLSGAGKSTAAQFFVAHIGAIQLSSDIERKRMAGLTAQTKITAELQAVLYSAANTEKVYARLLELAQTVLTAGYAVVVDATFLKKSQRGAFAALAKKLKIPFGILQLTITRPLAETRLAQRATTVNVISDADIAVFDQQLTLVEPLTLQEQSQAFTVTNAILDSKQLTAWYAALSTQVA